VVASLVTFDFRTGTMTWAGVGNVEVVLVRADRSATPSSLVTIGGIFGGVFPEVRPQQLPLAEGDVVVLATDGIRREFVSAIDPAVEPSQLAADLLARYQKGTDDALVLAIRFMGRLK
jgi:hypothetical protein